MDYKFAVMELWLHCSAVHFEKLKAKVATPYFPIILKIIHVAIV